MKRWMRPVQTVVTGLAVSAIYLGVNTVSSDSKTGSCKNRNKVFASATETCPLVTGDRIPGVRVKNVKGQTVRLRDDLQSKGPAVLVFYRGGWCPYCNTHMKDLKRVAPKIRAAGYRIIGISPDSATELKKSSKKHKLSYTLMSDAPMRAAKAFGLAFRQSKETLKAYKTYGIDLKKASGGQTHNLLPVPAVYVVNRQGNVLFHYVNPDYKVRLEGDRLVERIEAATPKAKKVSKN